MKPVNKMYVIVRNDLSVAYRCVQGAHALTQYSFENPKNFRDWKNEYLIFLSIPSLLSLKWFVKQLKNNYVVHSVFKEPDLGNHMTAVAFRNDLLNDKMIEIVKELPLTY